MALPCQEIFSIFMEVFCLYVQGIAIFAFEKAFGAVGEFVVAHDFQHAHPGITVLYGLG